jgi:glyoxylase-like metal-dependent hydrolase (beta-lactamase superfamily II)
MTPSDFLFPDTFARGDTMLTESDLIQLTEHVWMYPPAPHKLQLQPSIGVIITPSQTVLYDAGNSPAHAHLVQQALHKIHAPPVSYVIYSHVHWDHIFGGQTFATTAEIVAHQRCNERVHESASKPWGEPYLKQLSEERPSMKHVYDLMGRLIVDWDGFEVITPTMIFDTPKYTLALDGVTLELEHVGGEHSDDSTVLRVLEEKVMFLSDSFYPKGGVGKSDEVMMTRFKNEHQDVYIDGHNGRIWS